MFSLRKYDLLLRGKLSEKCTFSLQPQAGISHAICYLHTSSTAIIVVLAKAARVSKLEPIQRRLAWPPVQG